MDDTSLKLVRDTLQATSAMDKKGYEKGYTGLQEGRLIMDEQMEDINGESEHQQN